MEVFCSPSEPTEDSQVASLFGCAHSAQQLIIAVHDLFKFMQRIMHEYVTLSNLNSSGFLLNFALNSTYFIMLLK